MIKRMAAITYHFLLEFNIVLLFLFFFYFHSNQIPPYLNLCGMVFGAFLSFVFLLERFANKGKWLFLFIVYPLLLVVGVNLEFSVVAAGLMGLFIFWRGVSLYNDYSGHSETLILLISFIGGILLSIYSGMIQYPHQNMIISLLILQISLVFLGLFISKWNTIKEDRMKFILYYCNVLIGAAAIGAVITFSIRYLQAVFFGILSLIARAFSQVTIPLLYGMEFILSLFGNRERKMQKVSNNVEMMAENYTGTVHPSSHWWIIFLIIAGTAFVIYLVFKKRAIIFPAQGHSSIVEISEGSIRGEGSFLFKKRVMPPADSIRREIFHLEKLAKKMKLGRKPFETLDEWWARVGLTDTGHIKEIYENVRYGGNPSAVDDITHMKEQISEMKEQLKEAAKKKGK